MVLFILPGWLVEVKFEEFLSGKILKFSNAAPTSLNYKCSTAHEHLKAEIQGARRILQNKMLTLWG